MVLDALHNVEGAANLDDERVAMAENIGDFEKNRPYVLSTVLESIVKLQPEGQFTKAIAEDLLAARKKYGQRLLWPEKADEDLIAPAASPVHRTSGAGPGPGAGGTAVCGDRGSHRAGGRMASRPAGFGRGQREYRAAARERHRAALCPTLYGGLGHEGTRFGGLACELSHRQHRRRADLEKLQRLGRAVGLAQRRRSNLDDIRRHRCKRRMAALAITIPAGTTAG